MIPFNWVDYSIILVIGLSVIISFIRGFIKEAISLAVWLIALLGALKFAPLLQIYLRHWIASNTASYFIAFVILFLAILLVGTLLNTIISSIIKKSGLGFFDRIAGAFFGALRGIAIVAVVLTFTMTNSGTQKNKPTDPITHSYLAVYFQPLVNWLHKFLPDQVQHLSNWMETTEWLDNNRNTQQKKPDQN